MNELRLAVASVVQSFEIRLGKSYDDGKFREGLRDHFSAMTGPCFLEYAEI